MHYTFHFHSFLPRFMPSANHKKAGLAFCDVVESLSHEKKSMESLGVFSFKFYASPQPINRNLPLFTTHLPPHYNNTLNTHSK